MVDKNKREEVEGFKITKEQQSFFRVYKKVVGIQNTLKRGIGVQMDKLASMQQMLQEIDGKRKELLLQAPDQAAYDVADEGMVEKPMGKEKIDERLRNASAAQR